MSSSTTAAANRAIFRAFKLRGLSVKADAVAALVSVLTHEDDVDGALDAILDAIKGLIERGELKSSLVDRSTIETVVKQLTKDENDLNQEAVAIWDAFSMPKMTYEPQTKSFAFTFDKRRKMNPDAGARARMFRERYQLARQRVMRNELFVKPIMGHDRNYLKLVTVDSLLGTQGEKNLLGCITQVEEGCFYLEDMTGHIPLDFSDLLASQKHDASLLNGLYTENSLVLVGGQVLDDVFRVWNMGFPFPESRQDTMKHMRSLELYGPGFTPQQYQDLALLEKEAHGMLLVTLADLHLDRPTALEKLRTLFQGYETAFADGVFTHLVFVLMGDFTSKPTAHGSEGTTQLLGYFDGLSSLLKHDAPALCAEATFIFVPGPHDPGAGAVLPRGPLPASLTQSLTSTLQHAHFVSNPCRLRLFTQEVVLFREDVMKKMLRHSILQGCKDHDGHAEEPLVRCLVQSLLDQGHLCPLPLKARPIAWEYDNALRLYPLPDLLILGDHSMNTSIEYAGCQVLSPGCFPVDNSFAAYYPATRTVEASMLPH